MPTDATTLHTPAPTAANSTSATVRDTTFDIVKGLSIIEVVCHHVLSYSMRKYATAGSWEWWTMAVANRILHFAVPTFLLVSALLLARSLSAHSRPDWGRFFRRRSLRSLWPYLVWTAIYLVFRLLVVRTEGDVRPVPLLLPFAGWVQAPQLLTWEKMLPVLFAGKAYFHLYFMVLILQLSLLFPLLFALARSFRRGFGGALAVAMGLQLAAFGLQSAVFRWQYPASTLLWYLLPVLVGLWMGVRWSEWAATWRRWRAFVAGTTLVGFGLYFWMEMRHLTGGTMHGLSYNVGIIVYATGVALLLLPLSSRLSETPRLGPLLARVGDWSLPIFLIHPLALYLIGGPTLTGYLQRIPFAPVLVLAAVFSITWVVSAVLMRWRWSRSLLFGR